jgi:hypothetical protein
MTQTITYDEAVALLDRAVAQKGADYKYEYITYSDGTKATRCAYRHPVNSVEYFDDYSDEYTPGCIIGHVASYLDVLGNLSEGIGAASVLDDAGFDFDSKVDTLFSVTQAKQDNGHTWGEAVRMGKAAAMNAPVER